MRIGIGGAQKPAARDIGLPLGACLVLGGMVLPVTPFILDLGVSLSLGLAISVVLTAASGRRPLDFSAFPTVLLVATLFRLSLNIASTRLILLQNGEGSAAAGRVIEAFGKVMVGGNYVVGLVVFIALAVINFAVITKGASRVAEVAARFTLDAMPGKQMAVDADLNAGIIGEREARERRRELAREADFYAAMDGIGKFVRGDAVAAILIMVINLAAGLAIGIFQHGMKITEALHTYTILTIGDGLAAQIPALLTSTAAGLIVSRAANEHDLSFTIDHELLGNPQALFGTAGLLGLLSIIPGLPHVPFLAMTFGLSGLGYRATRMKIAEAAIAASAPAKLKHDREDKLEEWPEPLRLELGSSLVSFVNEPWKLSEKIKALRPKIHEELGITIPAVRIADNLSLEQNSYRILLRATEVARGTLRPAMWLAIPGRSNLSPEIKSIATKDPAFNMPAYWISAADSSRARAEGCAVVDALTVLLTHFSEAVRANAPDLLSRKETERLLEQAQKVVPRIIEELSGVGVHLGALHRILQSLLSQRISIRDMPAILEAIAAEGYQTKDPAELVERIRHRISRIICEPLRHEDGSLYVFTVDPALEEPIINAIAANENIDSQAMKKISDAIRKSMSSLEVGKVDTPVIIVTPQVRKIFERIAKRALANAVVVLGASEVPPQVPLKVIGKINW